MSTTRKVTAQEQYYQMQVVCILPYVFEVHSASGNKYTVDLGKQTCTCPDFQKRQEKCKHIWRVELEGYEAPSEIHGESCTSTSGRAKDWQPDGDFAWFDSRNRTPESLPEYYAEHGIFLVASGRKKQYKFWAAFPLHSSKQLILYWGDANEGELSLTLSQQISIGQGKVIKSHAPYREAEHRMEKKKSKGYYLPAEVLGADLQNKLQMAIVGQLFARGIVPGLTMQEENKEKTKKSRDWKSENISWF